MNVLKYLSQSSSTPVITNTKNFEDLSDPDENKQYLKNRENLFKANEES
jgi:hypothetical protein